MMRSRAALTWVVSLMLMGACVNVDKPTAVVECERPTAGARTTGAMVQPVPVLTGSPCKTAW